MTRIDREAAKEELEKAAHLRAKATTLVDIAAELEREAESHEDVAQDLTAPPPTPPADRRR